jgi:hypothetical protein
MGVGGECMTTSALSIAMNPSPGSLLGRWLAAPVENPDFPLTHAQAVLELERMRATPVAPKRPLLVLAGYHAWRVMVASTARTMRSLVGGGPEEYHAMAYPFSSDIEGMAKAVVREVGRVWPHDEPHRTAEIDVIGVSMGGIVARIAAQLPLVDGQKRLRIVRLFTLATPHQGALLAERLPSFARDRAARDLHPQSRFLERLNASLPTARYELTCYARLNDKWVGATRTAPPGREPVWVSGLRFMSHTTIAADTRILADIARRLRGEEPLARRGSTPPTD